MNDDSVTKSKHIFTAPYSSTLILSAVQVICSTGNPMIVTAATIKDARGLGGKAGHGTGI